MVGRRQFIRSAGSALALLGAQPLLADEGAEIGRTIISAVTPDNSSM